MESGVDGPSYTALGPIGGGSGKVFSDGDFISEQPNDVQLTSVKITANENSVLSFQTCWKTVGTNALPHIVAAPVRGNGIGGLSGSFYRIMGDGKARESDCVLGEGEHLVAVEACQGHSMTGGWTTLRKMRFCVLEKGGRTRTTPWFKRDPTEGDEQVQRLAAEPGYCIQGFFGSAGGALDSLGILCSPIEETFTPVSIPRRGSDTPQHSPTATAVPSGLLTSHLTVPAPAASMSPSVHFSAEEAAASLRNTASGRARASEPCQVMLSYRVPESGAVELGGDGTVVHMQAALEALGFSVFVGENDLHGGELWAAEIQDAVNHCAAMVVICTETYGATTWTLRELQLADNKGKPLIPVWHSGTYPPPAVEIFLSGSQRVPAGSQCLVETDFQQAMVELADCLARRGVVPERELLVGGDPAAVVEEGEGEAWEVEVMMSSESMRAVAGHAVQAINMGNDPNMGCFGQLNPAVGNAFEVQFRVPAGGNIAIEFHAGKNPNHGLVEVMIDAPPHCNARS